jgi:hypothetical protein
MLNGAGERISLHGVSKRDWGKDGLFKKNWRFSEMSG